VGNVALDTTENLWVLPRGAGDAELLRSANGCTIADYGYSPAIGGMVCFRDRRRRFASLAEARRAKVKHPVPLLRATEIRADGTLAFQHDQRPDCYIEAGVGDYGVVRCPAVAIQRVSAPTQSRRLNCAPVPRDLQLRHDGVIGENHVTFLVAGSNPAVSPELLARIMSSTPVDRLFRCRSGAKNVSVYELSHLPLPNPTIVEQALANGAEIDDAVREGYGIRSAKKESWL
jgi:adenine-specific DNA-methyltransferase